MNRRRFLSGLVGVAGLSSAALLAACGQTAAPAAKSEGAGSSQPAAATAKPAAPIAAASPGASPAASPAASPSPAAAAAASQPAQPQVAPVQGRSIVLSYWFWADDANIAKIFTDSIDRFHQSQNKIQIKPDQQPSVTEAQRKVLASAAVGQAPDVSYGPEAWLQDMYDSEMLLPLEDYFSKLSNKGDFVERPLAQARVKDGQPLLLLPNQVLVNFLYYRQDWFQEAGLKPPDTFDEMLAAARTLSKAPERYGFALRGGDTGSLSNLSPWYMGNGIKMVDEKDEVDFDAPAAIETTEKLAALYSKDKVAQPSAPSDKFQQLFTLFQSGKAAMLPHALHSYKSQSDALGDKASAVPTPRGSVRRVVDVSVYGQMIFKQTKNPDAAWEFVNFMAQPEQVRAFSLQKGTAPTLKSVQADPIYKENRFFKAALGSEADWLQAPTWHRNWLKFRDTFVPMFQQVLKDEISAKKMHEDLAKILRAK